MRTIPCAIPHEHPNDKYKSQSTNLSMTNSVVLNFTNLTSQHYQAAQCTDIIPQSTKTNTHTESKANKEGAAKDGSTCSDTHTKTSHDTKNSASNLSDLLEIDVVPVVSSSKSSMVCAADVRESLIQREWEDLQLRRFQQDVWSDVQRRRQAEEIAGRLLDDAEVDQEERIPSVSYDWHHRQLYGDENEEEEEEEKGLEKD